MNEVWRNEAQKEARRKQKARYLARVAAGTVARKRPEPNGKLMTRWQKQVARRKRRRAEGKRIWGEMMAEWARIRKAKARAGARRNRENRERLIAGRKERLRAEEERRSKPIKILKAMAEAGNEVIDAFLGGVGEFSFFELTSPRGKYYDPSWNKWVVERESAGDFLPARYQATGNGGRRPAAYVVAPWTEKDFRTMDRVMRSLAAAEEDPRIRAELQKTLKAIRPKAKEIRREAMLRLGYHVPALQ